MDIPSIFTTVGSTLGVPATLILYYLYQKFKDLDDRIKKVERDNEALKTTLGDMRADISFIRGKLEGEHDPK